MGKRNTAGRFTEDGLPRNASEWTEDDWRTLWEHLQAITSTIGAKHAKDRPDGEDGGNVDHALPEHKVPRRPRRSAPRD